MPTSSKSKFDQQYRQHLQHLKLKGLRPKTIDAYSRVILGIMAMIATRIRQAVADLNPLVPT